MSDGPGKEVLGVSFVLERWTEATPEVCRAVREFLERWRGVEPDPDVSVGSADGPGTRRRDAAHAGRRPMSHVTDTLLLFQLPLGEDDSAEVMAAINSYDRFPGWRRIPPDRRLRRRDEGAASGGCGRCVQLSGLPGPAASSALDRLGELGNRLGPDRGAE